MDCCIRNSFPAIRSFLRVEEGLVLVVRVGEGVLVRIDDEGIGEFLLSDSV